ncbi:bZIP transcription factor 11-like isoform X1 [Zingiber officinale]|uniref:bZIP transcription factor 11-like isoform X1 n=1 Tax=Zingiber officinale TaxID=94328 RepID=UPI001C4C6D00|nr:bZIP transcription factor 11-like isoform X1 [Zingiber officinale]
MITDTLLRMTNLAQSFSVAFLYWFYVFQEAVMDRKKRKRMLSNRESARRSRMRKQKKLSDLIAEVNQLKKENSQILTVLSITTRRYSTLEAQNFILKAQLMKLSSELQYFSKMSHNITSNSFSSNMALCDRPHLMESFTSSSNMGYISQLIIASAEDMLYY